MSNQERLNETIFSKDSWHFRLATVYGPEHEHYPPEDICSYISAVLAGAGRVLLFTLFGGLIGGLLGGSSLAWVVAMIVTSGWISPHPVAVILPTSIFVITLSVGLTEVVKRCKQKLNDKVRQKDQQPSFLNQAYSKWKDKTCIRISFK